MELTKNKLGYTLLEFETSVVDFNKYPVINYSVTIIDYDNKFLICYNRWRKQWELPGGRRNKGETLENCAKREVYEETGQGLENIHILGFAKISSPKGRVFHLGVYYSFLTTLKEFIPNDEIKAIKMWDMSSELEYFDEINAHLMRIYKER